MNPSTSTPSPLVGSLRSTYYTRRILAPTWSGPERAGIGPFFVPHGTCDVQLTALGTWFLGAQDAPGPLPWWLPLAIIVPLFYLMMIRPERNRQKTHQAMLNELKKNDRVVTVGGIHGVVTNVQRENDEVTLKVDETTNAKLRVTFGSIARVVDVEAKSSSKEKG